MKLQYYKDSNYNNNNEERFYSSASKNINEEKQNEFLIKYKKLYGNSFSDVELNDIFIKHNYDEKRIKEDIKALLSIEDSKKFEYSNKDEQYSPSFGQNSNSKKKKIKNENIKKKIYFNSPKTEKEKENNSQKDTEVPSDYAPPPKHDEIKNFNNERDVLLEYKKAMFDKLKNQNYSYKSNKSKKDELNYDNINKYRTEKNIKIGLEDDNIELNKNYYNIKNKSPGPECLPLQNKSINKISNNQKINKEQKKKFMKYFFGNMKNYNNNIKTKNPGKSPDITKRKNLLDSSPDKVEFYEKKIFTYKKGMKNKYPNTNTKTPYDYLEIESKVNNIFISSCYDNPQRDHILKMINEKRKQNPDKIVEVLFTQFPSPMPFYSNLYQPYNQFNPYMYMMPSPPNYQIQPPMMQPMRNDNKMNFDKNQSIQGINEIKINTPNNIDGPNSLINSGQNQINNNTHKLNYNSNNNNYLLMNNAMENSNNKSLGNMSNNGNINTSSSFK